MLGRRDTERVLEAFQHWTPQFDVAFPVAVDDSKDRMLHPVSLTCAACIPIRRDEPLSRRPSFKVGRNHKPQSGYFVPELSERKRANTGSWSNVS